MTYQPLQSEDTTLKPVGLLSDSDRREADALGERIRAMHRITEDEPIARPEDPDSAAVLLFKFFLIAVVVLAVILFI